MKSFLLTHKRFFAFLLALGLSMGTVYAYDFYKNCSTGQRLYYNIIDATNRYVEITYPVSSGCAWCGVNKPTGPITLPSTVTYGGVTYTVTRIGNNAFEACDGLTGSLTIPSTVTEISVSAFAVCSGFTGSLTLPNSITYIGECAFSGCSGFTGTLTIPSSVTSIEERAFEDCSGFTGTLTIPSPVTFIGWKAFYGCSGFTGSLTIPNLVTIIDDYAFEGCSGFTGTLTIGTGVTSIGMSAFKNCTGFTKVKYNAVNCDDVTYEDLPFEGCRGTLIIGSIVQRIPAFMFYNCIGFTGSLTIPNSVTTIGESAFEDCAGFNGSLTIGNSVTTIGNYAFNSCNNFTGSLSIPNSVTTIGEEAFSHIGFTGSLTIPNSVTTIGASAFAYCSGFTGSLTIPNSLTMIGEGVFAGCGFNGSLTIPNSVTTIGVGAFWHCTGFTGSLTIPNSVTTIGVGAFNYCNGFTSLTIGSAVTTIDGNAFNGCSGLASMTVLPEMPPTLGTDVFYGVLKTIPVYVPCASLGDYQTADGWSEFINYQCLPETLTVYDGITTSEYVPAYIYYFDEFSRSQFVIPADNLVEIAGTPIHSMTFYTTLENVPYTTVSLADVYLKEVDYTSISVYEDKASATIVYSGYFSIEGTDDGGEMTIHFSTPYTYNGGNLLVGFENTQNVNYKFIEFYGQTVNGASIADMTGTSTGTIPATQRNFIPKTTFSFLPTCEAKTLPYNYGFEEEDEMGCWTLLDCSVFTGRTNITRACHEGDYGFRFSYYDADPPQYLISPKLESTTEMTVSFYYKNSSNYWPETFQVGYSTTTKSPNAFIWGEEVIANDDSRWMLYEDSFPEGTKYVAIKYNSYDEDNLFLDDFSFDISSCPKPCCLTETDVTSNSALLGWTGYQDSYEVRIKKKPYFFEDFENGLPFGWTTIDNDGDGYDWHLATNYGSSYCHSGSNIMVSASYDNDNSIALTPDNWLITPQLELRGTMKVWIRALQPNYAQEHFAIYLSTTGNSVSDFTTILVPETTLTNTQYRAYTADLSAYAGRQGYIAIRHFNCTDMYEILLDDFGIFGSASDDWVSYDASGESVLVDNLTPASEYEWQVRGVNCDGNDTYTEWSETATFTTLEPATVTQTVALSAGTNWFSTNVEVTLDDLKAALLEALPNTSVTIKGKSGSIKYIVRTHTWNGTLDWDVTKMYKIEVPSACEITLEGAPVNPVEHPVTISPNTANWIGYPLAGSMTVAAAFADFGVVTGDVVKSKSGSTRYRNGSWRPNGLTTLEPGQGYIYNSASSTPRVLSFAQFEYVDLGLPSGTLWATCNVGASSPEDYGDYFAWGETTTKDTYDWSTYQYANGTSNSDPQLTKYCNDSNYGYSGFTDNLTTLLPEDDAVTANWGNGWRMPTNAEWEELYINTTKMWTTQNGVNGYLFTASNGNSIFMPAAGGRSGSGLVNDGSYGYYWTSLLVTSNPRRVCGIIFHSNNVASTQQYRYIGLPVRPVRSAE